MNRKLTYGLLWCLALLLTACSADSEPPIAPDSQNADHLSVSIAIPATFGNETTTRTPGDPGTYEELEPPTHLYMFILSTQLSDEAEELVYHYQSLEPTKWLKEQYNGNLPTKGDFVYRYSEDLNFPLPSDRKRGKIYAVLTNEKLEDVTDPAYTAPSNTSEVVDLAIDLKSKSGGYDYIRDIYTTPYNLGEDGTVTSETNDYYGTIRGYTGRTPTANLVLYHIAAKVDVTWNVDPSVQSSYHITDMRFDNMLKKGCHLFKPTENVYNNESGFLYGMNSSTQFINIGNQWYGRYSYYAIPYKYNSKFPIEMQVYSNGNSSSSTGDGKNHHTITINVNDLDPVFTPWVRPNITIKKDLGNSGTTTLEM